MVDNLREGWADCTGRPRPARPSKDHLTGEGKATALVILRPRNRLSTAGVRGFVALREISGTASRG